MPVPLSNQFGDLFVNTQLESVLADLLRAWMPTYLAEVVRQHPLPDATVTLAPPASVATHRRDARWGEESLPSIVVQIPGTTSTEKRGDGTAAAWWAVTVLCVVQASTLEDTNRLSGYYTAAARGVLMQQRHLLGLVDDVEWLDERHDRILTNEDKQRSLQVGSLTMHMLVEHMVNARFGPLGIDDAPDPSVPAPYVYPPLPDANTIIVAADAES